MPHFSICNGASVCAIQRFYYPQTHWLLLRILYTALTDAAILPPRFLFVRSIYSVAAAKSPAKERACDNRHAVRIGNPKFPAVDPRPNKPCARPVDPVIVPCMEPRQRWSIWSPKMCHRQDARELLGRYLCTCRGASNPLAIHAHQEAGALDDHPPSHPGRTALNLDKPGCQACSTTHC